MNKNKTINVLFCGTGGQGVLKAAEVLSTAAMREGYHVKKSEVHGMSQRGGSVESHVRFGTEVFSPLIPEGKADFLVAFQPEEGLRLKKFLKKNGKDMTVFLEKGLHISHGVRYLNTYLLGILSTYLPIRENSWLAALGQAFADKNLKRERK
jgi:indolepyruvate ferredoxin oxidoreductase beta subunit